ncbi:hypothetical protein [Mucilaginibacter sp.]
MHHKNSETIGLQKDGMELDTIMGKMLQAKNVVVTPFNKKDK